MTVKLTGYPSDLLWRLLVREGESVDLTAEQRDEAAQLVAEGIARETASDQIVATEDALVAARMRGLLARRIDDEEFNRIARGIMREHDAGMRALAEADRGEGPLVTREEDVLAELPDGWRDIVEPVVEQLRARGVTIVQTKSKFAKLRVYYQAPDKAAAEFANTLIKDAEQRCAVTCEDCGAAGAKLAHRIFGGAATLCVRCVCVSWRPMMDALLSTIDEAATRPGVSRDGYLSRRQVEAQSGWEGVDLEKIDDVLALLVAEEAVAVREIGGERYFARAPERPAFEFDPTVVREHRLQHVGRYIRHTMVADRDVSRELIELYAEALRRGLTDPTRLAPPTRDDKKRERYRARANEIVREAEAINAGVRPLALDLHRIVLEANARDVIASEAPR